MCSSHVHPHLVLFLIKNPQKRRRKEKKKKRRKSVFKTLPQLHPEMEKVESKLRK